MGSPDMLPPLYDRLRQYGIVHPDAAGEGCGAGHRHHLTRPPVEL